MYRIHNNQKQVLIVWKLRIFRVINNKMYIIIYEVGNNLRFIWNYKPFLANGTLSLYSLLL